MTIADGLLALAVPIDNLITDPNNARRGDAAAIRRSLNVFGQRKPVVVKRTGVDAQNRPTGIVIAGNHTLMAARELGWPEVAAVFVDDDASTAAAYALADNRTGELAVWDQEQLTATLRELSADEFDMAALGWTETDLATLLSAGVAPDVVSAESADRPPEVVTPPAGDVRALALEDDAVDAVVCDPPYELGFMGKHWDASGVAYDVETWRSCYRVLKPGGHLLAFGGTRTSHRMAAAIEDAGFEIRDSIIWLYGSGFPKSLDVSKAIDKAAGAEREKVAATGGLHKNTNLNDDGWSKIGADLPLMDGPIPATDDAQRWQGWGTALKPAHEPIVVARKPLSGTVADNVLANGTGALNVDGCRVPGTVPQVTQGVTRAAHSGTAIYGNDDAGRWPSNVALSHLSDADGGDACADGCVDGCPVAELDGQSGVSKSVANNNRGLQYSGRHGGLAEGEAEYKPGTDGIRGHTDTGGASRFFPTFRYTAKAPTSERPNIDGVQHPTVKPLELMRWLVRLVTPPGGTVLDPFAGSGTTIEAALVEGFAAVAVERHAPYHALIEERIARTGAAADRYRVLREGGPFPADRQPRD